MRHFHLKTLIVFTVADISLYPAFPPIAILNAR